MQETQTHSAVVGEQVGLGRRARRRVERRLELRLEHGDLRRRRARESQLVARVSASRVRREETHVRAVLGDERLVVDDLVLDRLEHDLLDPLRELRATARADQIWPPRVVETKMDAP